MENVNNNAPENTTTVSADLHQEKPIEETNVGKLYKFKEQLLTDLVESPMVKGEDYWVRPEDGVICSNDYNMETFYVFVLRKYERGFLDVSGDELEKGNVSLPLETVTMETLKKIRQANNSRLGYVYRPIHKSCARFLFNSNEEFLALAKKVGMVEDEDYIIYSDGTIHCPDRLMEKLIDYVSEEYRKENAKAHEDLLMSVDGGTGLLESSEIMFRLLNGDFVGIKTFKQYTGDYDGWPDTDDIQKMEKAGLIQDRDFVILISDPEDLTDVLITEEGWSRFIAKYPEYDRSK